MSRQDDPLLTGDMVLLRRIPPKGDRVQWDPITGAPTPASQNFKDRENELSTYIAAETTVEAVLEGHEEYGVVQFRAGKIREVLGAAIILCRDTSDPLPGHVLICGDITNGMAKKLKNIATWVEGRWPVRLPSDS